MGCGSSKAAPPPAAPPPPAAAKPAQAAAAVPKAAPAPVAPAAAAAAPAAAPAAPPGVELHGVALSMNCAGAMMMVETAGCGQSKVCMPFQDTNSPEFLGMNPFHGVPVLKDGDFILAESSAILRYLAETRMPEAYPEEPKLRHFIEWAMERFNAVLYKDAVACIYSVMGFASPPDDVAAAGKACSEHLEEFANFFLQNKFVGGEKPSITDYKIAPFFFAFEHPHVQASSSIVCPARIKDFNKDFAAAVPACKATLGAAGGLKETLDKAFGSEPAMWEGSGAAAVSSTDLFASKKLAGSCVVHGGPFSPGAMTTVLLAQHFKCGEMKVCVPLQDTVTPEFLALNPFHQIPTLQDGDYCLAEANAILRYIGAAYGEAAYPKDPKVRGRINWAIDRFTSSMLADVLACIYPLFGYAPAPANQAAAGQACSENLESFAKMFLTGKFIGGDTPSIADFKVAPFFFCYEHAVLQERSSVVCPERLRQFNKDFLEAVPAASMLRTTDGWPGLGEMLDKAAAEPARLDPVEQAAIVDDAAAGQTVAVGDMPSTEDDGKDGQKACCAFGLC
eukprot:TRINITY_DN24875_c0_g1_i2.p1 TRINITY_DN24875_c0_g1~~TRINITY_DN24875_c0_g1_i2.p1  ORF type:complete len:563 (+),score=154.72 TRINITY_DN24875_c0_g1_i2:86-1774(+)